MTERINIEEYKIHNKVGFNDGNGFVLAESKTETENAFVVFRTSTISSECEYYWGYYTDSMDAALANYKQRISEYVRDGHLIIS